MITIIPFRRICIRHRITIDIDLDLSSCIHEKIQIAIAVLDSCILRRIGVGSIGSLRLLDPSLSCMEGLGWMLFSSIIFCIYGCERYLDWHSHDLLSMLDLSSNSIWCSLPMEDPYQSNQQLSLFSHMMSIAQEMKILFSSKIWAEPEENQG